MQLGTRWSVGDAPPASLPALMVAAVAASEADLSGVAATGWRWTLTWLEGRPVVELDDGTTIRVDHSGEITVEEPSL